MPRRPRDISISGIYHVTFRGVNKQLIFEDDKDRKKFISLLRECKQKDGFEILAYCLMTNHVHLMLRTHDKTLGEIMNRLLTCYAGWFNWRYKRSGHLFQDRFFSEPIEDKDYLLTAWRYVLHNPIKAGMETAPGKEYKWSSITAYFGYEDYLTDVELILSCFDNFESMTNFINASGKNDQYRMMIHRGERLSDEAVAYLLKEMSACESISDFQKLDKIIKIDYLQQVYRKHKVSIAQLARVSGMAHKTVSERLMIGDRPYA